MKKHLNTLFVTTQGAYLAKDGECVLIRLEGEDKARFPAHLLDGVICFGNITCSPFLLGHLAENNISISFLTENGRFLARSQGPVSGNVLLRREQYRWADDPIRSSGIARSVIAGKVVNARAVLRRGIRDHGDQIGMEALRSAILRLDDCAGRLERAAGLDELRGIEGEAANVYFSMFDRLITRADPAFRFNGRNKRPPLDRVNCLLSFTYTLLAHDIRSALECTGLDPAVGFLHRDRPGRSGLALDIMEEFRPFFADRLVLTLINRGQVEPSGFEEVETGAVLMGEETRKTLLTAYQERKQDVVTHPFLKEKMTLGLAFQTQALLLARHIRGDLEAYPPFFWK